MSKSKFRIYNGKSLKKISENSGFIILSLMFITGLTAGAIMIKSDSLISEKIAILSETYTQLRSAQSLLVNFCNSFAGSGIFLIVNIFLGFSLIGFPFLTVLPLIKGLGLGAFCGFLYSAYGLSGFFYSLVTIYPGAIVSAFSLVIACCDSCEHSKNAYNKSIKGRGQFEKNETQVYLIRQLVFLIICAVSSVIDAVSSGLFSRFFEI